MRLNKGRIAAMAGAISMALVLPVFANQYNIDGYTIRNIVAMEEAQLIHKEMPHWAEFELLKMQESFQQAVTLMKGGLDEEISYVDFQSLIRSTLDSDFSAEMSEMTREEAVSALMELWAEKTVQDLGDMVYPMILVFEDTEDIQIDNIHKIMVAYFNGITKGKGNRRFSPKDKLTFAEAVTLVNRIQDSITAANEGNNGGIAAGSFETRADYKVKETGVTFNFELFSHFTRSKELTFSSGKQFDVVILDENQKEVYRYSDDKMFTMALIYKTLGPGESISWQDTWDKTNKDGEVLSEGKFTAVITIDVIPMEGQEFDESQFKTEIEFNL